MRNSKKQLFWVAALGVLGAGWAACTKTGSSFTTTPVTYVSILNQAPYGPTADVYLNDTLATGTSGVGSGTFSSRYGSIRPGDYQVKFKKNGKDSLLDALPTSRFDTLNFYTLVLYNNPDHTVKALKIHDDFSQISQTSANYRFFNLSPDAANVDLFVNEVAVQTGRGPADNVIYDSFNAFSSTAPGTYTIKVKAAGKDSVLATLPNATMVGGNVYTIFLSGVTKNMSINVLQASY